MFPPETPRAEGPVTAATGNPAYDALPEGIKALHPYDGWLWLSDAEKAQLVSSETEPEF